MSVILLVATAAGFDLPATGDRFALAAELGQCLATGKVETPCKFGIQPGIERRIRFDGQFTHQGSSMKTGDVRRLCFAYPVVDKASSEVGMVDPLGDLRIVRVRHQQGKAEAVQQTLGGAFPVAFVFAYLDQFAGKRQRLFIQNQCLAQPVTDGEHLGGNVRATLAQGIEFQGDGIVLILECAQLNRCLGEFILCLGLAGLSFLAFALQCALIDEKGVCI